MANKGIFVTGTGTDVGKTFVSLCLCSWLKTQGVDVGVFKPFMSGIKREDKESDVRLLKQYSGDPGTLEEINPFQYDQPLAPGIAQELENKTVTLNQAIEAFEKIEPNHNFYLVEGAGGLYVPCGKDFLISDFAWEVGYPLLIVASPGLGTINHTLLTVHYAATMGLPVAGIILNGLKDQGLAEKTNPAAIEKWSGIPVLGTLPWLENYQDYNLSTYWANFIDLPLLRERIL